MKSNRKVLLNIGIPGSGKSTWSKDFLKKNPGWVKIGRDDFRFMLRNEPMMDFRGENLVTELVFGAARKALLSGFNVILDNTHCKLSYINQAIEKLNDLADIDYRYFDVPLATCTERDKARERSVGEEVIKRMHKDLVVTLDVFDFQPKKKAERKRLDYSKAWDVSLRDAVIFDVDGTLAHMDGKRGPFDWHRVDVDRVDPVVARQFKMHKKAGDLVLVVSGRDESCRELTEEWLEFYELEHDGLFMRPTGDFRKDSLIKAEIYENKLKGNYNIIAIYDDRNQVVDTWRNLGLKVFQVEPGEF
jgi:predicted kinase